MDRKYEYLHNEVRKKTYPSVTLEKLTPQEVAKRDEQYMQKLLETPNAKEFDVKWRKYNELFKLTYLNEMPEMVSPGSLLNAFN